MSNRGRANENVRTYAQYLYWTWKNRKKILHNKYLNRCSSIENRLQNEKRFSGIPNGVRLNVFWKILIENYINL